MFCTAGTGRRRGAEDLPGNIAGNEDESGLYIGWTPASGYEQFLEDKQYDSYDPAGDEPAWVPPEGYITANKGKWDGRPCWGISDNNCDSGCMFYVNYQDTEWLPLEGWEVLDAQCGGPPPTFAVVDEKLWEDLQTANEDYVAENPWNDDEECNMPPELLQDLTNVGSMMAARRGSSSSEH